MTNEPSPRPWSLFVHDEQEGGDGEVSICAEGEWIATMNLRRSTAKDDAALIVAAVNERDRLRAALEKMVSVFDHIAHSAWFMDANFQDTVDTIGSLNDARAALGAGETPTGKGVGR